MLRRLASHKLSTADQAKPQFGTVLKRKLLSGTGLVTLSRIFSLSCIFVLVYIGGEEPTGIYTTIASMIGLSSFAIGLGIPANYSYFLGQKQWSDGDIAATRRLSVLLFGCLGGGGWFYTSELLHKYLFHSSISLSLVGALGICIPIWIHHSHTLYTLQSYHKLGYYSLLNCLAQVLPVLIALMFYQSFGTNDSIAMGYLVGSVLVQVVSILLLTSIPISKQLRLPVGKAWQAIRFGLIGYTGALASLANYRLDLIFLAMFFGPAIAGNYAILSRIAEVLRILPVAMQISMTPRVAGLTNDLAKMETSKVLASVGSILLFLTPITYMSGVLGMSAMKIQFTLFGFAIILFGTAFAAYTSAIVGFNLARGKALLNSVSAIAGLVATLATMPWMVYCWGIFGACISSGIAYSTMSLFLLWQFSRSQLDTEGCAAKPTTV